MLAQAYSLPIARRLIGRYLMFGLAGMLVCICLVAAFHYFGTLSQYLALAAAAELILLFLGAVVLERTVRVAQEIEQQLQSMASLSPAEQASLQPLADKDATARGWNSVIERLRDQQTNMMLESRFNSMTTGTDDKRWTSIFNALHEGIVVCNRRDEIIMANNAFFALLGIDTAASVIGQNIVKVLESRLQGAASGLPHNVSTTGVPFIAEVTKVKEIVDGLLRISRTPMLDDQSESSGNLWTVRDITQQKMADEMRNQFVFTATHELRTPLANIKAYAETLALSEEIELRDQKNFCNIINSEATRLARFVDELLNMNQIESGAVTLIRGEVDIERLLNEVIENLRPQIVQKELKFEHRFPAKLPKLAIDKDKMVAALVNLLGNAVKYTPTSGTVRFVVEADESNLNCHVEDTGIGISAEELPRLTEKFFRSSDERVQGVVGSGLGLAFSQEVARLHGGTIMIKSELNKGSRFTLALPLSQGDAKHVSG